MMQATPPTLTTPPDRILRARELADRIGLSLATLGRLRRRGDLPEPIRLSPGCVGWRTSDIEAWLAARTETSGHAGAAV
jgi:prophage regulatory protein